MRRIATLWCLFALFLLTSQVALAVVPMVTIDSLTTGTTVGGSFIADYTWKDCTGVASMKVEAVQNGKSVGSESTPTTQASASQKNKLVTTTAKAGTEVEVTVYALDAAGKEIKKSTTQKVKVK